MPDTLHILLGEPNEHFQNSLQSVIKNVSFIELDAIAYNTRELLQLAGKHTPDVLITDVDLPPANGFETIASVASQYPSIAIIALSFWRKPEHIQQAIDVGAIGIICKHSPCDNVLEAIKEVHAGREYRCRRINEQLETWRKAQRMNRNTFPEALSEQELLALQSYMLGMTHAKVATITGLSPRSMEDVKQRIMKKIGAPNFTLCMFRALLYQITSWPEGI